LIGWLVGGCEVIDRSKAPEKPHNASKKCGGHDNRLYKLSAIGIAVDKWREISNAR
jgi:hypothetical protein